MVLVRFDEKAQLLFKRGQLISLPELKLVSKILVELVFALQKIQLLFGFAVVSRQLGDVLLLSDTCLLGCCSGLAHLLKTLHRRVSLQSHLLKLVPQIGKTRDLFVRLVSQRKLLLVETVVVLP